MNQTNQGDQTPLRKSRPDQVETFNIQEISKQTSEKINSPNKNKGKNVLEKLRNKLIDRGPRGFLGLVKVLKENDCTHNNLIGQ